MNIDEFLENPPVDLRESIFHFLGQRASYICKPKNLSWVHEDPILKFLLPSLYFLHSKKQTELPEDVLVLARHAYFANMAGWMMREQQLKKILNNLHNANIDVIPLKGVILQSLIYRDRGLRAMGDIDILVRPENFLQAASLLAQSGLQLVQHTPISLEQLVGLQTTDLPGELTFHDGQGFGLDLHKNLMPSNWFSAIYDVNMDAVWERSIPLSDHQQITSTAGEGLWKYLLSPYDMLAHLCLHSAQHGLQNTKSYLDVDLWIRNLTESWVWESFIQIVNQWHARSAVYHMLIICKTLLGTPVPGKILKQLDPGWLARWRVRQLISPEILISGRSSLGTRYPTLVKLALADNIAKIALSLVRAVFPYKSKYTKHPSRRGILGHWQHIIEVVKRGD